MKLSESTVGIPDGPVCGSTATTWKPCLVSTTVGVTRMAPSMSVPDRRASERRSQPTIGSACPGGVGEQLVVGLRDLGRGALEQLGRERLELGDQDAEHVGAVAAKALRTEARLVAELVDDLLHPVDGRLRDAVASVDDLGDGRHRDAGRAGDVGHLHAVRELHASDHRAPRARFRKRYRQRLTATPIRRSRTAI